MTTDGISPIPHGAPPREAPPAVAAMVRTIQQTWRTVEPYAPEISRSFYNMLFTLAPETRDFFPINMESRGDRLIRALVHVIQLVDRPDDLLPFLQQLGRSHRKFGVEPHHYEAVGTSLLAALREQLGQEWTSEVERTWAEAYTIVARSMQEAAAADTGPAVWTATVAEHHRVNWDIALIRLELPQPIPYQAGQYLSVEVPQRPRLWRHLSPSHAPRPDGSLELHVRAVDGGWVSRGIVSHTQAGDTWRIGPPMGSLRVNRETGRDVLMIAGGTGLTPLRAILDDLAQWGENPRVTLFYGGRSLDDLHDLEQLRNLVSTNPWLTVRPVVEHGDQPPGFEQGTLAEVVTRRGAWPEHDILISGSPAMIRATVSRLLVAGTALGQIHYDPFIID